MNKSSSLPTPTEGGRMGATDVIADLSAVDHFMLAASQHRSLDRQLMQLEADAVRELHRNPVEGPQRIIAAAGYVARLLMGEHDLDDEVTEAQSQELMARLNMEKMATHS
jgi:hypothetical protein